MKKRSKKIQYKGIRAVKETSAGVIAFLIRDKKIHVLLLVRNNAFLGIDDKEVRIDIGPKGHVEKGESIVHAASRETREEIGIPLHIDTHFKETINYSFTVFDKKTQKQEKISKKVVFFLAFMNRKDAKRIALSEEHIRYYIVPVDEAMEKIVFQNQKDVIEKAREYISVHYLT